MHLSIQNSWQRLLVVPEIQFLFSTVIAHLSCQVGIKWEAASNPPVAAASVHHHLRLVHTPSLWPET